MTARAVDLENAPSPGLLRVQSEFRIRPLWWLAAPGEKQKQHGSRHDQEHLSHGIHHTVESDATLFANRESKRIMARDKRCAKNAPCGG